MALFMAFVIFLTGAFNLLRSFKESNADIARKSIWSAVTALSLLAMIFIPLITAKDPQYVPDADYLKKLKASPVIATSATQPDAGLTREEKYSVNNTHSTDTPPLLSDQQQQLKEWCQQGCAAIKQRASEYQECVQACCLKDCE